MVRDPLAVGPRGSAPVGMQTPDARPGRSSVTRSRSHPRAAGALPTLQGTPAFPDGPLAAAIAAIVDGIARPGASGGRQPPQSSGPDEALYAFVLHRGRDRLLYIGSQRDPAVRGDLPWDAYVEAVRVGRDGALIVRNRVRSGWTLGAVHRGYGDETAVTFWARALLSRFPEWEVTGGLYALRGTQRNTNALQVWEWQRLRCCTICGSPGHGAVFHDGELEAGELAETCGEVSTLQRELGALRGQLGARELELAELRRELEARDRTLGELRGELQARELDLGELRERQQRRDEELGQAGEAIRAADAAAQAARLAQQGAEAAARRFPTEAEWLALGTGARVSEAELREVIDGAEATARRSGASVRGKVLRRVDGDEFVVLRPLARLLLPSSSDWQVGKWARGKLASRICDHAGAAAVRKVERLGERTGLGNAPWACSAAALFGALAP